jgi:hypothetical protein
MKRRLIAGLILVCMVLSVFTGCQVDEATLAEIEESFASSTEGITTTSANTTTKATTTVATTTTAPISELDLPLVIENNTVSEDYYIDVNGNVKAYGKDEVLMTNVRSIYYFDGINEDNTYFFIKNDNTLWGFGKNYHGFLGEVSDIDDINDAVKLPIENVANVYAIPQEYSNNTIYVVTTDKELYGWGEGEDNGLADPNMMRSFTPVKIADDVIRFIGDNSAITSTGFLISWNTDLPPVQENNYRITRILSNVADALLTLTVDFDIIDGDGKLYSYQYSYRDQKYETVQHSFFKTANLGLCKIYDFPFAGTYYLAQDSSLYGVNPNVRDFELIKIADSVKYVYSTMFIDKSDNLYEINSFKTGANLYMENVAFIYEKYSDTYTLKTDGTIVRENGSIYATDVALPGTMGYESVAAETMVEAATADAKANLEDLEKYNSTAYQIWLTSNSINDRLVIYKDKHIFDNDTLYGGRLYSSLEYTDWVTLEDNASLENFPEHLNAYMSDIEGYFIINVGSGGSIKSAYFGLEKESMIYGTAPDGNHGESDVALEDIGDIIWLN